jgi:hypothetical protein
MPRYYLLRHPEFEDLIRIVAGKIGIDPALIEKDGIMHLADEQNSRGSIRAHSSIALCVPEMSPHGHRRLLDYLRGAVGDFSFWWFKRSSRQGVTTEVSSLVAVREWSLRQAKRPVVESRQGNSGGGRP